MLIPMLNVSYFYISTSQSVCALYVTVLCSYMMHLPGMLLRYFLNEFEINAVSPIITGINLFYLLLLLLLLLFSSFTFMQRILTLR